MNDQPIPTPALTEQLRKVKNHRYFKAAIIGVAAAGGAFLAVRASLKQITDDVHHMAGHVHNLDHNVYNEASHVIDEIHAQQRLRNTSRRTIDMAMHANADFDYYPGLGVRYASIEQADKAERKWLERQQEIESGNVTPISKNKKKAS